LSWKGSRWPLPTMSWWVFRPLSFITLHLWRIFREASIGVMWPSALPVPAWLSSLSNLFAFFSYVEEVSTVYFPPFSKIVTFLLIPYLYGFFRADFILSYWLVVALSSSKRLSFALTLRNWFAASAFVYKLPWRIDVR